jgi:hypothetical protein
LNEGIENVLSSTLVSKEVMDKYQQLEQKLKKELALISLEDHVWYLKLRDVSGVGVVKIHCAECIKDFGGKVLETILSRPSTTSSQTSRKVTLCLICTFAAGVGRRE